MPGYNFKACFADDVESGKKAQTIRPRRKRPTQAGDMLYMFTGQRTKRCRKLGQWQCTGVEPIRMYPGRYADDGAVEIGKRRTRWLTPIEVLTLAQADGFHGAKEFYDFFREHYGIACDLEIIKWDPKEAEDA